MFDMSFSEIAVIGVVALVVLGPERLPKVARTAGQLFGRLQRYVATVKADINREMDSSELAKIKQEVQDAARSFEQSVQQTANSMEKETTAIGQSLEESARQADAATAPVQTQNAMLAQQDEAFGEAATAPTATNPIGAAPQSPPPPQMNKAGSAEHTVQASFDFGIEPVRMSKSA